MSGYAVGDYIPSHFNGSIVAASYFASLCGCVLTIELLHRRGTALGNLRSWLENFACAVAFGVMGIWCMHFIGNRAIVMDRGQDELQLVYAPGFTTLSVFLPIIGLTLAFAAAEYPTKSGLHHWLALTGTGVFAGLSIVGMHYVGNMGIYNYTLTYNNAYLAASIIIAIGDCLGVLVLFYTWRDKWISAIWYRVPCAMFLAGGVSAMHFTASVGCIYQFKSQAQPGALHQTDVQVIIASALCGAAALTVLGALSLTRYRIWSRRQKAKKVMLLCAVFDEDGKLLVTTEGVLPAHEITDKYNAANFSESFDTAHPVFHWIFRVSFNWSSVSELIPRMKLHINKVSGEAEDSSRPTSSASSAIYDPYGLTDYTVLFREQFCVAAAQLATALHIPLDKIGVLYDKIIETGTHTDEKRISRNTIDADVEMSQHRPAVFGRGQALVLTSQVDAELSDKLLNAGYKFATIGNVSRQIADSMQVDIEQVEQRYNDLLRYITNLQTLEKQGTWVGFFAPVPLPHNRGFEVPASILDQNQLPDVQILPTQPAHWQHQILLKMDGKRTGQCLRYLDDMQRSHDWSYSERGFAAQALTAFRRLSGKVPTQWWTEARFYCKALGAPYSRILTGTAPPTALYSFIVVGDIHTQLEYALENTIEIKKVPFSFFSVRQRVNKFSRDHQILAREIHQEFGAILGRKLHHDKQGKKFRLPGVSRNSSKLDTTKSEVLVYDNSISSTSDNGYKRSDSMIVEGRADNMRDDWEGDNMYGGILVNSETVIRSDSTGDIASGNDLGLGAVADASRDRQEDTFADELLQVTMQRFMTPSKPGF